MSFRTFASVLMTLLIVAAMALPVQALPQDCDVKCGPTTPPDIVCACPGVFRVSTCGAWWETCYGGFLTELPSDSGLPNTVLDDLGIFAYGTR